MAKFANNVDSDQGQLGTNVAWMYDSLAKRGAYKQVGFLFFFAFFYATTVPLSLFSPGYLGEIAVEIHCKR